MRTHHQDLFSTTLAQLSTVALQQRLQKQETHLQAGCQCYHRHIQSKVGMLLPIALISDHIDLVERQRFQVRQFTNGTKARTINRSKEDFSQLLDGKMFTHAPRKFPFLNMLYSSLDSSVDISNARIQTTN
jgi:hypothetical protein